ncbi:NUDIX domain-containing protein [Lutibacter sp. HS1-25]|uniref:NUDIX hydrolase n=1 Tax=Lutibacter sp. HS1-25 TaxID=2485000 RepID=UPI00101067BA|nr:NUDIX domain-containing protein [Lutibacter sp. HS1-25]RXP63497.1 NUDIX domain-containing protein [Lutibacter sp. HS1-25]
MDEYIDILNEVGEISGKTCLKSEAHQKGLFHASVHIWIFDNHKNILIQKRALNKDTFPGLWDISVAGHISAGELPIDSAIREVSEEVGISIQQKQLHYIGTSTKKVTHKIDLIDNELHHIYICSINFNIETLKIQQEEVAEVKLIPLNELILATNLNNTSFVPHGKSYYEFVLNAIKNTK